MILKPATSPDKNAEPHLQALKIYDPARKDFLPSFGRDVGKENPFYWARAIDDGSVIVATDEAAAKAEIEKGEAAMRQKWDDEKAARAVKNAPAAPAPQSAKSSARSSSDAIANQKQGE